MNDPISRGRFQQIPQSVSRANEATDAVLRSWLTSHGFSVTDWDDPDGPDSTGDARTRVLAQIVQRQGQPAFRAELLSRYDGKCVITQETAEAVLEAAHIQPYMGLPSNTMSNGLLLRSDIHTLFDLHLLGVDSEGRVVLSPSLAGTSYAALAGKPVAVPDSASSRPSKRRLAAHLRELRP